MSEPKPLPPGRREEIEALQARYATHDDCDRQCSEKASARALRDVLSALDEATLYARNVRDAEREAEMRGHLRGTQEVRQLVKTLRDFAKVDAERILGLADANRAAEAARDRAEAEIRLLRAAVEVMADEGQWLRSELPASYHARTGARTATANLTDGHTEGDCRGIHMTKEPADA